MALPVQPIVVVKDASGSGVAGVTVSFAVDSGGGTLDASSANTATNGTASPGNWKLGSAEGRNVMHASVGSLEPLKIVATAQIASVTLPPSTVGSGGGSVTVARPGTPIDGLKLDIASGAFTTAQDLTIGYGSSLSFPRAPSISVLSPTITIQLSNDAYASKPMFIRVPATVPAGTFPSIVMRDPASGREEVMPTVQYSGTAVTGMTSHFSAGALMAPDGSFASLRAAAQAPTAGVTITVIATPTAMLDQDLDTGFRPGVDAWEFPLESTVLTVDTDAGTAATEAWYYTARKGLSGKLWNKYQEATGVPESNRRGFRWVSLVDRDIFRAPLVAMVRAVVQTTTTGPQFSVNSFNSIRAALVRSPGTPQMGVVTATGTGPLTLLVYEAVNHRLLAVSPTNPSQSIAIDFASGTMTPLVLPALPGTGTPPPLTDLFDPGITVMAPARQLAAQFPAVTAGTIGNAEFPTYRMMVGWGPTAAESAPAPNPFWAFDPADLVWRWADCVTCVGFPRRPPVSAGSAPVAALDIYGRLSGVWTLNGTAGASGVGSSTPGGYLFGYVLFARNPAVDPNASYWMDWATDTVYRLATTITPAAPSGGIRTVLTLTFGVTGAPGNLEYEWDFGDGLAKVVTPTATTQYAWATPGTYTMKVTARDQTTKEPVAKATAPVKILDHFVWRVDAATVTGSVLPPSGIGPFRSDTLIQNKIDGILANLQGSPANSLIFVSFSGNCGRVVFEQFPTGQVVTTGIVNSLTNGYFASSCVDPIYTGSFNIGPLGNGTLTGSLSHGVLPLGVSAVGGGSINGVMTPGVLSGTFTWNITYSTGTGVYAVSFHALQVVP